MYTAKILRRTADKQQKKLYVDIAYHLDGGVEPEATESKEFGIEASMTDIAYHAKRQIERLEKADTNLSTITVGDINLSLAVDIVPTTAETDKNEWFRNFSRLEQVQRLIGLGILTGTETQVVNLRNKVKNDFKPAYIADM
jgi:hypothetical protein